VLGVMYAEWIVVYTSYHPVFSNYYAHIKSITVTTIFHVELRSASLDRQKIITLLQNL
jgi:hypothetical protein